MPYNKKNWVTDEVISTEALNHIEQGIADVEARTEKVANRVTTIGSSSSYDNYYPTAKAVYDLFSNTMNVTTKKY